MTSLDGGLNPIGEGPKFLEGKIDSPEKKETIEGSQLEALSSTGNMHEQARFRGHTTPSGRKVVKISESESPPLRRASLKSGNIAKHIGIGTDHDKQIKSQGAADSPPVVQAASSSDIPKLENYQLSREDYDKISNWYSENKSQLEADGVSKHLKTSETKLPRTVIYIAKGPHKGLHVRSKVTVGVGSFNKATRALHIDTGKAKVARSAKAEDVSAEEIARNNEYAEIDPEGTYFATGAPIEHKGSWKDRREISDVIDRGSLPKNISQETDGIHKETQIDKVTFIMDEIPDGEMADDLFKVNRQRTV